MRKPLSRRTIQAAIATGVPEGKPHVMAWDAAPAGLGLKVRPSGTATWVYLYRPKGERGAAPRTLTIGKWPGVTLDEARTHAIGYAARIARGVDPAREARAEKIRERAIVRFAVEDYLADMKHRKLVRAEAVAAILRRGFGPVAQMEIGTLDRRTVVGLIERVATTMKGRADGTVRPTIGAAIYFKAQARAFLEFCTQRGIAPYNILAGYRTPRATREQMLEREANAGRALSDAEIVRLWRAASDGSAFGALVRLGLVTGLRRNELSGLKWSEVGDDRITIPAHHSKMGRLHAVSLTPLMRTVLASSPRAAGPYVFPSSRTGEKLRGWTGLMARVVERSDVRFKLHDLRRSTRTLFSKLGVDEATAELAIGHVRRGLVGTYNKDDAWPARAAAFEKVSAHIASLLTPLPDTTIVRLPADRRHAP